MILQNKMISLPTYPNFFGPVTGTTGIFSFGLMQALPLEISITFFLDCRQSLSCSILEGAYMIEKRRQFSITIEAPGLGFRVSFWFGLELIY